MARWGGRKTTWLALACGVLMLAACAETQLLVHAAKRVAQEEEPAGRYKVGDPYQIGGVWYYPAVDYDYVETGIASWYGPKFHGRQTANGEVFDMNQLSAAHRTLPMPSVVQVVNLENGRSLRLRINDRGPFAHGRIIDVSRRAAQLLGFERQGTARVRVLILADESRREAARLQGAAELAAIGTPITVARLPKPPVTQRTLPPPGSAQPAGAGGDALGGPVDGQPAAPAAAVRAGPAEPEAQVDYEAVGPTRLFVQAGAYAVFDNANRVRARLASLGTVVVTSVLVGGRDVFRVRIGPLASVEQADGVLDGVIRAGYPDARIIVAD